MSYRTTFTIIDADTFRPLRHNRFTNSIDALMWGYRAYGAFLKENDKDFLILDGYMRPVPASQCRKALTK